MSIEKSPRPSETWPYEALERELPRPSGSKGKNWGRARENHSLKRQENTIGQTIGDDESFSGTIHEGEAIMLKMMPLKEVDRWKKLDLNGPIGYIKHCNKDGVGEYANENLFVVRGRGIRN
jgi:hypothetical protein